jgi:hypothetical protein
MMFGKGMDWETVLSGRIRVQVHCSGYYYAQYTEFGRKLDRGQDSRNSPYFSVTIGVY